MTYRGVRLLLILIIATLTSSFTLNGNTLGGCRYVAHHSMVPLCATGGFGTRTSSGKKNKGKNNRNNQNHAASLPLSSEAKKLLKKHNGDVDLASAAYFRSQMENIMPSLPNQDSASTDIEGLDSASSDSLLSHVDLHRERVATTWDTVALFLPNDYARTKGRVEPEVDRKLKSIAKAATQHSTVMSSFWEDSILLDVGCGDGALVPYLYDIMSNEIEKTSETKNRTNMKLKNYYGLDISQKMIELAKQRWTKTVPLDQFLTGSFPDDACHKLNQLPVASCGTIIFNGSLQFFRDTIQTLKDAQHILSPGGRIVISHVNGAYFVKDECQKNPGVALRMMPNKISVEMMADVMGMKVIRKEHMDLPDLDLDSDGDDDNFYLVVLEKPMVE